MLRLLQIGLGPLGRAIVRELHERRLGRVVAAVDVDPELAGRSLGTLLPELGEGPRIESELSRLDPSLEIDCAVVATSSWLTACAPTFRELLARGFAVVSTCEELVCPRAKHPELAQELDELARERGGRLLGTGVNPGFLMDALPAFATSVCRSVESLRVERVQDASLRRVPFQQKVGVGLAPEEFDARVRAGRFGHAGLEESARFLAERFGFELDAYEESIQPIVAEREHTSGLGPVGAGLVRGLVQQARASAKGTPRIELYFLAALDVEGPYDGFEVRGAPPLALRIEGGVPGDVATSALVLNAIPSLLAAPPGLHTMASIPMPSWRAGLA